MFCEALFQLIAAYALTPSANETVAMWIDSHCHLDAPIFDLDRQQVLERARQKQVSQMVILAVSPEHFDLPITLAHQEGLSYALGIHPLWLGEDLASGQKEYDAQNIAKLRQALETHQDDPRLVAVGEIGLDYFVEGINQDRQWFYYIEQLKLAKAFGLPVLLHVRRSADMLLKGVRQISPQQGIVHAFNGSQQQAQAFIDEGFKLGFGGAATFERATQIRRLIQTLPLTCMVLETDAPDMPPRWVYTTAEQREMGSPQGRNEPAELEQIARTIAQIRGISVDALSKATIENTLQALPKLRLLK